MQDARRVALSKDTGLSFSVVVFFHYDEFNQSNRMELNTALAHVPSQFKSAKSNAGRSRQARQPKDEEKQEHVVKQLAETGGGTLGARALVALADKDGPKAPSAR